MSRGSRDESRPALVDGAGRLPPTIEEFERRIIESATYFVVFVHRGRGDRYREEVPTLEAGVARRDELGPRALLYAVAHVNHDRNREWQQAVVER